MDSKDEDKIKGFIKFYYDYLKQGMAAAECVVYCTILSYYVDETKHKDKDGYMVFTPDMFKHIKISTRQKARIMDKLVNDKFIIKKQKAGSYIFKIKVLKDKTPPKKWKWWKIKNDTIANVKIDEKTKRSDYILLLINAYIDSLLERFLCVNYDKLVKSGLFDTKTIRAKLKLIDDLKAFRIDGRLYWTGKPACEIKLPPDNATPDKDTYNTNDVYTVCRTLKMYGNNSIEVLRTYNAMGRVLYPPVNDNDKDKAVAYG